MTVKNYLHPSSYYVCYSPDQMGGHSAEKYHAADPNTQTEDPHNRRLTFTSRCGRKVIDANSSGKRFTFASLSRFQQCGRCLALLQRDYRDHVEIHSDLEDFGVITYGSRIATFKRKGDAEWFCDQIADNLGQERKGLPPLKR
jgi:hypothetical protein